MKMKPQRIQRKRVKGYDMQAASPNSLPVVSVTRPGKWGNPYRVIGQDGHWFVFDGELFLCFEKKEQAVECSIDLYREYIAHEHNSGRLNVNDLRGKNLACFCKEGDPCHGDVLLALANP